MNIAFLGLGAMGSRMAARLAASAHPLTVYNRSPAPTTPFAERGARIAGSPAEAVEGADVIISMLRDDAAARAVWTAALPAVRSGAICVEASTVTTEWIAALATAAARQGAQVLDAPVVGTLPQAEAGALVWLVGGAPEALERAEPVLRLMGSAIHAVGPTGHGAAAKLMVNAWFAGQVALLDEVLRVAPELGAPDALALLGRLPVTAPALQTMGALMCAGDHAPRFPIDLVAKDLGYATARHPGALIEATRARFEAARAAGAGGLNITAIGGAAPRR